MRRVFGGAWREIHMSSEENERYRCPCCGYKTLDLTTSRILSKYAMYASGKTMECNSGDPITEAELIEISLNEARANFRKFGAKDEDLIGVTRPPSRG